MLSSYNLAIKTIPTYLSDKQVAIKKIIINNIVSYRQYKTIHQLINVQKVNRYLF